MVSAKTILYGQIFSNSNGFNSVITFFITKYKSISV